MRLNKRSQLDQSTDASSPKLCANQDYYGQLNPQYPRHKILRMGRWLLSHFAFDALGLIGLIYILLQDFITNFANEGPAMLSSKQLDHWFAWQLVTHYPLVTIGVFIFLLSLIPVGFWMRRDEHKEKKALERRMEGLHLARGYRAYLEYVVAKTGTLPRLLRYDPQAPQPLPQDAMIFTPLRLVQTKLTMVQRTPLDRHEKSMTGKERDLDDNHKSAGTLDANAPPAPTLIVNRATDALEHAHSGAIIVLGQPGSGKTTLLRHLVWEQAKTQLSSTKPTGCVPIFLDLAMSDVTTKDLRASIKAEVEGVARVDEAVSIVIIDGILQGPSLIVVDGLDELLGNVRNSVRERLEVLAHTKTTSAEVDPKRRVPVQIAVSSRVSNFRRGDLSSQRFETWELLPLTDRESQRQLVLQVLSMQSVSILSMVMPLNPDQLLISLEERPQMAGWATNPLLLTLATLEWARKGGSRLAHTRVALYRNAVEELMNQRMKDWASQELTEAAWLAEDAALELFQQGQRSLTMQDFTEWIMPRLSSNLVNRRWGPEKLGSGDVLLGLSGLFILNSSGRYDIYHLTFLEYLAARALARKLIKVWPSTPVAPTVFLDKLRACGFLEDNDLRIEMNASESNVLAQLWLKRTVARWSPMLMMMTGVLSEEAGTDKLMSNFHRPDLAQAWIRALLDQPDDVGLLGLRLAAGCAAEVATTDWDTWALVQDIANRLVTQLCRAAVNDREGLKYTLKRGCALLAGGEIGQEIICDSLVARLTDPNKHLRQTVVETLGILGVAGRKVFPKLIVQLADTDQHVRKAVAEAIGMLGAAGVDVLHHLMLHLSDPDQDVRVAVIQAIGTLGINGVPALVNLCALLADDNENTAVCQAVVGALGTIRLVGSQALDILYERLADENVNNAVRVAIVEAIARIGAAEVDVLQNLLAHLTDSDWRVRAAVVQAIGKLGPDGVIALDLICARLTDKNENTAVRQAVAWAIGILGPLGASALDVLSAILTDENDSATVRQAVAWAIGTFGLDGAPALETLRASLANENDNVAVRQEIAETIGKIGITGIYVLPYLVPRLSDSNPEVRVAVAQAIGTLEHAGVPTLEILLDRLTDEKEDVAMRQAVAEAIGKIGTAEADVLPYLVPRLSDSNPEVRVAVAQAIGTLGLEGVPALSELCSLLKDSDASVREKVALIIGRFGRQAEQALPALVERLNDQENDASTAVEQAIRSIVATGVPVSPSLLNQLGSPAWQVRRAAAGIVKAFGSKAVAVLPQLQVQLFKPDKSAIVREKIAQAIGALGIEAGSSLPSLLTWLSDPEWRVREAMKRSIRELAEAGVPVVEQLSHLLADPNLNRDMQVAVVEAIKALVSIDKSILAKLYELLPRMRELLAISDDWYLQQAVEEAVRALQYVQEVVESSQVSNQLEDFTRTVSRIEREEIKVGDITCQLRDVDWYVRELAIQKIGAQTSLMEWGVPLLMEALADEEPIVSDSAAIALAAQYPDILNDTLLQDLGMALEGHPYGIFLPFAQRNELNLYLTLGTAAHVFFGHIVELLSAEHWSVREDAIHVLGTLRYISYATVRILLRLYREDPSLAVRKAAEEALEVILSLDATIEEETEGEITYEYPP